MNIQTYKRHFKKTIMIVTAGIVVGVGLVPANKALAQTCSTTTAPPTTYGQVKQSVSVATAGTYRVWSRIKAPNTTANSYYFQVDNGCAAVVGDASAIPANAWTWVNYTGGVASAYLDVTLTAGAHQLTYTGKEVDVQLDRVLLLGDMSCVPTGTGDNCATADAVNPTVSLTAPAAGTSVAKGSTVTISANASDNVGVAKVEFYVDGALVGTDTTTPYSYAWNTGSASTGSHSLTARAHDASGNTVTSAAVSINVTADTTPTPAQISQTNNLATGKTFASSVGAHPNEPNNPVTNVNDKNETSRWISAPADNAALSTDLGATYTLSKVSVLWAANTTKSYDIQVSANNSTWTTVASGSTNNTATQLIDTTSFTSAATGRYFRIVAKDRHNAGYGNSVWELGLYGTTTTTPNPTPGNGDANGDGRVNGIDYSILSEKDGTNFAAADFNRDGTVGAADLAILLSRWTW